MPNLMGRVRAAVKAFRQPARTSNHWVYWPNTRRDWVQEAGELTENSAVMACLGWIIDVWPEAPLTVYQTDNEGTRTAVVGHPLPELVANPNEWYGEDFLWTGSLLSLNLDGNAYWHIEMGIAGTPVGLNYIPHWLIEPKWPDDGSQFISHYEYKPDGRLIRLERDEVVHFRAGVDPKNIRKGLSRVKAVLREVVTDNEAAMYAANILKNMGFPGGILSPKPQGENVRVSLSEDQAEELKSRWKRNFTGDGRGEPLVMSVPIEVSTFSFSPDQLDLTAIRRIPEERIAAAFRIPPGVVKLGAGLDRNTFSNSETEQEQAYRNAILPTQRTFARQIDRQLLIKYNPDPRISTGFDTSNVAALTEDYNEKAKRVALLFVSNVIKRSEAREEMGMTFAPEDDFYADELRVPTDPQDPQQGRELEQRSMRELMDWGWPQERLEAARNGNHASDA